MKKISYLCPRIGSEMNPTKRESGEIPEQTRYCKSYATFWQDYCHCSD